MKMDLPGPVYRKDYQLPLFSITDVDLTFNLEDEATLVEGIMSCKKINNENSSLKLNGEGLRLKKVYLNETLLNKNEYKVNDRELILKNLPSEFSLKIQVEINPLKNTLLEGLYKSGGIYCTQNEPEGFRRIMYFLDRPDNMARFTTKIIANKVEHPVLLSNGNMIKSGDLDNDLHFATWKDPFPKPSYLYALVAGDLGRVEDVFTTKSGREIDLQIYCDKGNENKCGHAMNSLKKAMKWDEDVFGLEYDLDIYMIVAVNSFNMGAMENKGLNIFNSAYVLADPETATDQNFLGIEGVVAHEYFHNWTGNRVTCRDWFQLTLKEGLTVFRDQEFSADMNSRPIKRIEDVTALRSRQFKEDAGPNSHPIRPDSYIEINNFYTSTIYEKGAEIIRMIHFILGEKGFRRGIDLYFELFDGKAVTTDDFVQAMSKANDNYDFSQFENWYHQKGTPEVKVIRKFDKKSKELSLDIFQKSRKDLEDNKAFHFPLKIGLVKKDGTDYPLNLKNNVDQKDIAKGLLHIRKDHEIFVFTEMSEGVLPSINRDFSAPIRLTTDLVFEERLLLMSKDPNQFNRYEAGHGLTKELINNLVKQDLNGEELVFSSQYLEAFGMILNDNNLDNKIKAMSISIPSFDILFQEQEIIDVGSTYVAREFFKKNIVSKYKNSLLETYYSLNSDKNYEITPESMGRRSLKNTILGLLIVSNDDDIRKICFSQFESANNMTDRYAAFICLCFLGGDEKDNAVDFFYDKWKEDVLVMGKWLSAQAISPLEETFEKVKLLEKNEIYDYRVPNFVRSLIGSFAFGNPMQFHRPDGAGYNFIVQKIIELDKTNPQIAASLAGAFNEYKKINSHNQKMMQKELAKIVAIEDISSNVFEIASKILS